MSRKHVPWTLLFVTAGVGGCGLALGLGDFENACPEVAKGKPCPTASEGPCVPKATEACYSGDPGTRGVGVCADGSRTCSDAATWGPCVGETLPKDSDTCDNTLDDDCDGTVDDGCVDCEPGTKSACYNGPAGTEDIGICHGGEHVCTESGDGFSECTGQVKPAGEDCAAVGDEDCDGIGCSELVFGGAYGDDEPQTGTYLAADADGNLLVTGNFVGQLQFGPGATLLDQIGYGDVFLAKLDPEGGEVWSKNFGSPMTNGFGLGIAADPSGNSYLVGSYDGTLAFGGGVSLTSTDVAKVQAFIAKLDPQGVGIWAKDFGSTMSDAWNAVAVDKNGYAVVVGSTGSAAGNSLVIRKYGAAGNQAWTVEPTDTTGTEQGNSIATDSATNVYVVGAFSTAFTMGGQILTPQGGSDIFLVKLDSGGKVLWAKSFGAANDQVGASVAVDSSDNVVIAGSFKGMVNLGGPDIPAAGGADIFVAKFDPSGNHIMSARFGGPGDDLPFRMVLDSKDNVLLTGGFPEGTIDFGGGPLTSAGAIDAFLVKFDPSGSHIWSKRFGDFENQLGRGLAAAPSGRVGLLVFGEGSIDFGAGAIQAGDGTNVYLASFQP